MAVKLSVALLLLCFVSVTTIPMTIYNNAEFCPSSVAQILITFDSVATIQECQCQCYNNSLCVTGTYFGVNQTCILFSAHLWQGQLRLMINAYAGVFSFTNRTTELDPINPPAILEWLFDGNFDTVYGTYNGYFVSNDTNITANSNIVWVSPGYNGNGSAVHFPQNSYYVVNQYFDLSTISFTLSAWVSITFNFTATSHDYFSLLSQCQGVVPDKCLHLAIASGYLRLAFFSDDLIANVTMSTNQWYHVAYVYDRSTSSQYVFLNGNLIQSRTSNRFYSGNASQIVLGLIPLLYPADSFQNGYIDQLIFVSRVKNVTELLNEATLVAYYPFDNTYLDAGPNNINNIVHVSTTFDPNGPSNQALMINSTNQSYFQTTGFYFLGRSNYSYSFALWIYPFVNNGTIMQVSSSSGWCVPMIGFNENGYLTIQTLGINGIYSATSTSAVLSLNTWTHVCMTYSLTDGIQLFLNGSLMAYNNTYTDYLASGDMCTITIGNYLRANLCAVNQTNIVLSLFHGKIDELKIFSRELSATDVIQLMSSS